MKKKIDVKFKTKRELALAIIEGRKIYNVGYLLEFVECHQYGFSPFKIDELKMSRSWQVNDNDYQEEIEVEWWDNIPEGGIDCWVWDNDEDEESIKRVFEKTGNSHAYTISVDPYVGAYYATPVRSKDLILLENLSL